MSDSSITSVASKDSDYVVVARRYRPQAFEELIGQQHVYKALTGAIASDRVGHAYLFTGARGVGKTSAARILAKALNCEQGPTEKPCNECEVCLGVSSGDDVDVLEIDGASNRGIDEIRQLRQNVAVRPSRARFKVYIIDEVHMLTKEAFNALLKTLEEPPEHVKFIFATTEPNKIPITILSRCQRYDFAGIETDSIKARLAQIATAEGVEVEDDALQILAMRAAGSMRDSQSLLEQLLSTGERSITTADVTELLGIAPAARLSRLVQPLVNREAAKALAELDGAVSEGAEVGQIIDQLLGYFRDVMTQAVGCDTSQLLYALPGQHAEISSLAERLGVETLLAISQVLDQTAARLRVSTQTRTLAEMAIVRICHLENLDQLAALIEQLSSAEGEVVLNVMPGVTASEVEASPATESPAKKNGVATERPAKPRAAEQTTESATQAGPVVTPAQPVGAVAAAASAIRPTETVPVVEPQATNTGAQPQLHSETQTAAQAKAEQATTVQATTDQLASETEAAPAEQSDPQSASETRLESLTSDRVEQVWASALNSLTGIPAELAATANRVSLDAQGRLVASFPEQLKFNRDSLERPANRSRVEQALATLCGQSVKLILTTHQDAGYVERPRQSEVEVRRQQQADAVAQPFVQRALELFEGDPGKVRFIPPEDKS